MPVISIDETKTNEELEDIVFFFTTRILEEQTQLKELVRTEHRLLVHFSQPSAQSLLHSELTHLQDQILDYQDIIMELDCGVKVLRKLAKQNMKKSRQLQRNQKRREELQNSKSDDNSVLSLLSNESPSQLMAGPAAA